MTAGLKLEQPEYFSELIEQGRQPKRPDDVSDLLLRPIVDRDGDDLIERTDWADEHGEKRRFYLVGWHDIERNTWLTKNKLRNYSSRAYDDIDENTRWTGLSGFGETWDDAPSHHQFNYVHACLPISFAKGALIIATVEHAMRDAFKKNKKVRDSLSDRLQKPEDVYGLMALLPATYNINKLNPEALSEYRAEYCELNRISGRPRALDEDFYVAMGRTLDPDRPSVFDAHCDGYCITEHTATSINLFMERNKITRRKGWRIRSQSGKHLGTKKAAEDEMVSV